MRCLLPALLAAAVAQPGSWGSHLVASDACPPLGAPRVIWYTPRACPPTRSTDAIQLFITGVLDTSDSIAESGGAAPGLLASGYTLLAVESCPALREPAHSVPLQQYATRRGLTLLWTKVQKEPAVLPHELIDIVVPGASRESNRRAVCLARALSATSGPGGWNDPIAQLAPPSESDASGRLGIATPVSQRSLAKLQAEIARACIHALPIVVSHGLQKAIVASHGLQSGGQTGSGTRGTSAGTRWHSEMMLAARRKSSGRTHMTPAGTLPIGSASAQSQALLSLLTDTAALTIQRATTFNASGPPLTPRARSPKPR